MFKFKNYDFVYTHSVQRHHNYSRIQAAHELLIALKCSGLKIIYLHIPTVGKGTVIIFANKQHVSVLTSLLVKNKDTISSFYQNIYFFHFELKLVFVMIKAVSNREIRFIKGMLLL